MALACTWGGFADSDLQFSGFFAQDHTIAIRFLSQYPLGYAGAFFNVHGGGRYFVGQGDFKTLGFGPPKNQPGIVKQGESNLYIEVGTEYMTIPASLDRWRHIALVRTGNQMQVFIDGVAHRPFPVPTNKLPDGNLRFGQSDSSLNSGVGGQFYGLIDDFALFKTSLPQSRIKALADANRLTGEEEDLQVGYVFRDVRPSSLPRSLRRPLVINPPAVFRDVSENRSPVLDLAKVPLPLNLPLHLPFARGEVWRVSQGYSNNWSHNGYAAFSWDLVRDGAISGSEGEPIYSASGGRVRKIVQNLVNPDSGPNDDPNYVSVRQPDHICCDYLHIKTNSALVTQGDEVDYGTSLALVGDIGAEGPHLHMAVSNGNPSGPTFYTMPAAFSNYEAQIDGDWKLIIRGIPQTGQLVRRPVDDGPIRYTAIWEHGTSSEIQTYGVPYEQYRAKYDSLWNDGWRLAILEAVGVDDQSRYTAVWRPTGGSEFQLYGVTAAQLEAENDSRHPNGWRLDLLTSYVVNGHAHYTGVWRPGEAERPMLLGATRSQFDARDARLRDRGFRLHRLSTHTIDSQPLYSAVWRPSDENEVPFFDLTKESYQREYHSRLEFNFSLKLLSITAVNGEPRYSGRWVQHANRIEELREYGVAYADLRARYDVLWQTGWRLKILEPYVR